MTDVVIKVKNVSKVFRIYDHPADRVKEVFSFKRKNLHTDFPALSDINFEVKKGEFLGVVGKNGAGKSTLLKILSRELTPTSGSVMINGKVSLLQLGVGFNSELTGIENARFSSKLLDYSENDIEAMMEKIIEFADIGEFIHHPVKTYSSGMYSRLSFAVGININPDILIADEVLSVGDMRFSQKCLRKMHEFKEQGKTVIFVSHDIQSVNAFCDTAMWIHNGEILMKGGSKSITTHFQNYMLYDKLPDEYHSVVDEIPDGEESETFFDALQLQKEENSGLMNVEWHDLTGLQSVGDGRAEIRRMAFLLAGEFDDVRVVQGNENVILLLEIHVKESMANPQVGFVLYNKQGLPALHTNNDICGMHMKLLSRGQISYAAFRFKLPSLASGSYMFSIALQTGLEMAHKIDEAYEISVARKDIKAKQCGYSIIEDELFELIISADSEYKP